MQKKWYGIIGICLFLTVAALVLLASPILPESAAQPAQESITLGLMPAETSGLVYIAEEKGYFAEEGINLTEKGYPNGAAAVQGMENGEANLTLSSEFPLVAGTLQGKKFLIAGAIDRYYGTYLVARRDRGISDPADLAGKTIAIQTNSVGEFFLGRFLDLQGIGIRNVTLVNRPPDKVMTDMLENTSIDAVVTTPLNTYLLTAGRQEQYTVIPVISGQATYVVVAGNQDWVAAHPGVMIRFLKALGSASRYAATDPQDARAIVARHVNVSEEYIGTIWPDHQYALSFDQSLLVAMEDEARWMIRSNLTPARSVPDFLDSLDTRGMDAADPGAVTIVGRGDRP